MEKKHSQGDFSVKKCTNDGYRVQINGAGTNVGCKVICWTRKVDYGPLPDEEEKANADFIVTACNSYTPMLEALKTIAAMSEKGLALYSEGKTDKDAFKTLAGWVTEKAKEAIANAEIR